MSAGITIFILFFGVGLLDAIRNGQWIRAASWVGLGVVFFLLERHGSDWPQRR